MPSSKSDSPIPEDVVWGNLSPKSRLKEYMPQKRKTSSSNKRNYNIPSGIDEEEMNEQLIGLETPDLPVAPSGMLFPEVPTDKPKRKTPTLVLPAAPTTPLTKKVRKPTVLEQFGLKRTKLAEKTENQKKKNLTIRTRLDALVSRFKKGGSRKSTFKKSGAKTTFRKSRAKRNRTRKSTLSTFKKGGAKSKSRKSR